MPQPSARIANVFTLRAANLDSAFAAAFMSLCGGAYIVKLAQHLGEGLGKGAIDMWIGLLTAVPTLVGLAQIPGATWGRRYPYYKKFVNPGGIIWRALYIPILALIFVPLPPSVSLFLLLLCVSLGSMSVQIVSPIYNDWLAEMVPSDSRGWFFSRRNVMQAVLGAVAAIGGGIIFDQLVRQGHVKGAFATVFGLGIVFAAISVVYFQKMHEMRRENPISASLGEGIRKMALPFKDRNFRKTLIFLGVFTVATSFAGNFWSAYAFETLGMQMSTFQLNAVAHALGQVLSIKLWGFLSDKYGNKPVLGALMLGICFTPLPWILCVPGREIYNAVILVLVHVFTGICWGGIGVCQYNLLLATSEDSDRANYIGTGIALQSLIGGLSPMIGAQVMISLRGFLPDAAQAYHALFILTSVLRLISLGFLGPVREVGATSLRKAFSEVTRLSPSGLRAVRTLNTTDDESERIQAITEAGNAHMDIARDTLIAALHDPSPKIRRQAASSLAKLGGKSSAKAILHMLRDHPDLVEEEMVRSLGYLEDLDAVPYLEQLLQNPRPNLRRRAAEAIGRLHPEGPNEALRKAASQSHDPDLKRVAIEALGIMGDLGAAEILAGAVLDSHPSVRLAAASVIAELGLSYAAPALRSSLGRYADEACSEVAYALGAVGDSQDLPLILDEARRSVSVITRRRCLLGIARLLGVELKVYRLLLLDGMARDAALLTLTKPVAKKHPRIEIALHAYDGVDDGAGLRALDLSGSPLHGLVANPPAELFLVGLVAAIDAAHSASEAG